MVQALLDIKVRDDDAGYVAMVRDGEQSKVVLDRYCAEVIRLSRVELGEILHPMFGPYTPPPLPPPSGGGGDGSGASPEAGGAALAL